MFSLFKRRKSKAEVLLEDLKKQIGQYEKEAWIPVTEDGDRSFLDSKFSGIPFISSKEDWPACHVCNHPMQLFLQLNLSNLPAYPPGCPREGFVQLFYCTWGKSICEEDDPTFSPGSKKVMIRFVKPTDSNILFTASPVQEPFPAKTITNWRKEKDYPIWVELIDIPVDFDDVELNMFEDQCMTLKGEKLLGWPYWCQGAYYPKCPECGSKMHVLFQIDSEVNIPWLFGDLGLAHIMQCPKHPENLAFTWSCG